MTFSKVTWQLMPEVKLFVLPLRLILYDQISDLEERYQLMYLPKYVITTSGQKSLTKKGRKSKGCKKIILSVSNQL